MKNLVSQDYIDYQYEDREKKQYPYSGQAVDDLDKACHNHRWEKSASEQNLPLGGSRCGTLLYNYFQI